MFQLPVINHGQKLHLSILENKEPFSESAPHGDFGCDYSWNKDYTAYRIRPLMWNDDSSYLNYACDGIDYGARFEPENSNYDYMLELDPPRVDDGLPF